MITPRHTRVVESLGTQFGTLVREDYYGYPKAESNLYLLNDNGAPVWFAERPMEDDAYANPIRSVGLISVRCGTWNGFDCEIDLRSGKLTRADFVK